MFTNFVCCMLMITLSDGLHWNISTDVVFPYAFNAQAYALVNKIDLYTFGGLNNDRAIWAPDIYHWNANDPKNFSLLSTKIEGRYWGCSTKCTSVINNNLIFIFGPDPEMNDPGKVFVFDTVKEQWIDQNLNIPAMPNPVIAPIVTTDTQNQNIYVIGGYTAKHYIPIFQSSVQMLNTTTYQWSVKRDITTLEIYEGGSCEYYDGNIYCFGSSVDAVYQYQITSNEWIKLNVSLLSEISN
eukprot:UN07089